MTPVIQQVKELAEQTPPWGNWLIVGGSAVAAWLAPIASFIAIVWGLLQIYLAVEKRWFRKGRKDRVDD